MNKEDIKSGDILVSNEGKIAYVRGFNKTGLKVFIDGQRNNILDEQLHFWNLDNPIKDNRLVCDYTFAVRFNQFLDWIPKDWWMSQPHYYEEFNSMKSYAQNLLRYQIYTATDKSEIDYLKRLKLWPQ
jgi:hypothetical protein